MDDCEWAPNDADDFGFFADEDGIAVDVGGAEEPNNVDEAEGDCFVGLMWRMEREMEVRVGTRTQGMKGNHH